MINSVVRHTSLLSVIILLCLCSAMVLGQHVMTAPLSPDTLKKNVDAIARKTDDFVITGNGAAVAWTKASWTPLTKLDSGGRDYRSRFKILYSSTGLYVLFQGDDDKITTLDYKDFEPIFHGDVFEIFLHPHPNTAVYFEYEVNALDKELILAISNLSGHYSSWMPFGKNKSGVKKMVAVEGDQVAGSSIKSWTAEIFLPYGALGLLPGVPPTSGNTWHANFCRLDYDSGSMVKWSWSPGIQKSFHELDKFLSLTFE